MIRAVVRSPFTEPSFLISIRSFARRLPFTLPNTTTSRATISAVTFAVAPTVSFHHSIDDGHFPGFLVAGRHRSPRQPLYIGNGTPFHHSERNDPRLYMFC